MRRAFAPAAAGVLAMAAMVAPIGASSGLADTGNVVLTNNVLQGLSTLTPIGDPSPAAGIGIGIGLQGSNSSAEAAYLAGEYDPTSPLYGQYLDPASYETQFGVPTDRYSSAVSWLGSTGLQVQTIPGSSEYIIATGSVAQVEVLLNLQIKNFVSNGRAFYANVTAPTVPAALRVVAITGLNNVEGPRLYPQTHALPGTVAARPSTLSPSADMNLTTPPALWSIYDHPGNNKGEGHQLAIFRWAPTTTPT